MTVRCVASLVVGWALVGVGLIVTPLPIPLGIILLSLGLGLLMPCSRFARRLAVRLKRYVQSVVNQRT